MTTNPKKDPRSFFNNYTINANETKPYAILTVKCREGLPDFVEGAVLIKQ